LSRDRRGILEQNTKSRTDVGTSDFFPEIQEKLVPKTFLVEMHGSIRQLSRDRRGILEQNLNSRFYVGTSDFFPEIQEKLVPKTFSVSHVAVGEY
jgi:hypothetical protein